MSHGPILSSLEIHAALRAAGHRVTEQRTAIIDFLAGRADHPSAREIYEAVKARCPNLSLTTVYNTLSTLVARDLIREIQFDSSDNRFDTNLAPHLNLVCTRCRGIEDFDHELPVPPEKISAMTGFMVRDTCLEYRGLCAACQRATEEKP